MHSKRILNVFLVWMKKKIIPSSLWGRLCAAMILPILGIQLVTGYIFFDRHWDYVTRTLAQNIAGETDILFRLTRRHQNRVARQLNFTWSSPPSRRMISDNFEHRILASYLEKALHDVGRKSYRVYFNQRSIWICTPQYNAQFSPAACVQTAKKRLFSRTIPIFFLWILGSSIFFIVLSGILMRRIVEPLMRLSRELEKIEYSGHLKPLHFSLKKNRIRVYGAREIRMLTLSFTRMLKRLHRHMQNQTNLLLGLSHDLRSPLTRLKMILALQMTPQRLDDMSADVNQLTRMVEQCLAFAEIQSSDITENSAEHHHTSLSAVVQSASSKWMAPAHVNLTLCIPDAPCLVQCLHENLVRCLNNMIENAFEHAKTRVHVRVHMDDIHQRCILVVADDGPGIPVHQRHRVRMPFVKLNAARTQKTHHAGVGLGLSIVETLMHASKGHFKIDQDPELGGACLKLIFKQHLSKF